jgi:hypothetical protein
LVLFRKQALYVGASLSGNSQQDLVLIRVSFLWQDSWLDLEALVDGGLAGSHVVF